MHQPDKPHRGNLTDWFRLTIDERHPGLGYVVCGRFDGHPVFHGESVRTSWVVAHNEETGELETNNNRYTVIGPERK